MQQLSRRLSPTTLFMLSMNGIIGSGWLLAPFYVAKAAGPAAIFSWIIGGSAVILIAFTYAELSTMLPIAGGTAHIPQLSHGKFASFILSCVAWITSLMMAPVEVQSVLQYASLYFPSLMHKVNGLPVLSLWGFIWAGILMLSLCLINIVSYRGLVRLNFVLFIFKFGVIFTTIFAIFHAQFNPTNFTGLFASTGSYQGWQAILGTIATGGIIYAFNGFKNGVELAGEAKNLKISIPLSTVGAVIACLALYIGLQVCFIGALDPALLKNGWQNLSFTGDIGPFVGLAAALGFIWILKLLYVNAVVSPLGAGMIYVTSTARILFAMSRIGYVPKFLSRLNHQHFPMWAIMVNFFLGMLSFLPLPGWQAMMSFLVAAMVITYAMGPVALICLRYTLPERARPFRLPAAGVLCLLAFYCCNLFSYWTGWVTMSKLGVTLFIGLIIFTIAYMRGSIKIEKHELKSAMWILPYLFGLVFISYLGAFGGKNLIPFGWDFFVIGIFSMSILYLAIQSRATTISGELAESLQLEPQAAA